MQAFGPGGSHESGRRYRCGYGSLELRHDSPSHGHPPHPVFTTVSAAKLQCPGWASNPFPGYGEYRSPAASGPQSRDRERFPACHASWDSLRDHLLLAQAIGVAPTSYLRSGTENERGPFDGAPVLYARMATNDTHTGAHRARNNPRLTSPRRGNVRSVAASERGGPRQALGLGRGVLHQHVIPGPRPGSFRSPGLAPGYARSPAPRAAFGCRPLARVRRVPNKWPHRRSPYGGHRATHHIRTRGITVTCHITHL